jgi:hypothetical protein
VHGDEDGRDACRGYQGVRTGYAAVDEGVVRAAHKLRSGIVGATADRQRSSGRTS